MKHFSAPSGRLRTGDRRHILWEIHRAQGALRARSSFAGWLSETPPRSRVVAGVRCQELELRNNLAENAMRPIALRPPQLDTHRKRGSRVARCSDRLGNRNLPKLKICRNLAVTSTVGCSDGYCTGAVDWALGAFREFFDSVKLKAIPRIAGGGNIRVRVAGQ